MFGSSRNIIFKKKIFKTDLPFGFVKLGSEIQVIDFSAEKWSLVCFVAQYFISLSDLAYFFKIEALIKLRKMLLRKKIVNVQLGNYSTARVLIFCRAVDRQIYWNYKDRKMQNLPNF